MPAACALPLKVLVLRFVRRSERRLSAVSDKALAVGVGREDVTSRIPAASALPLTPRYRGE